MKGRNLCLLSLGRLNGSKLKSIQNIEDRRVYALYIQRIFELVVVSVLCVVLFFNVIVVTVNSFTDVVDLVLIFDGNIRAIGDCSFFILGLFIEEGTGTVWFGTRSRSILNTALLDRRAVLTL